MRPRAGWHLYKAYADGYRSRTVAAASNPRVYALASSPGAGQAAAQVLLGSVNAGVFLSPGPASVDITVRLNGIDRMANFQKVSSVIIHVDRLADTGEAPSAGFSEVIAVPVAVNAGSASLTLPGTAPGEAYRLRIEPPAAVSNTASTLSIRAFANLADPNAGFGPGSIISMFADGLNWTSGVSVLMNGGTVLSAVGNGSVLAQAPDSMGGRTAYVQIRNGMNTLSGSLAMQSLAPALFDAGSLTALAMNQDGSQNLPASPAMAGEQITIFFTGTGQPGSAALRLHTGSAILPPLSQGRSTGAGGFGWNWANFTVPALSPGRQPVYLEANGVNSPSLYFSVR
jgi:uncharacterized protein (TIGR03437 family)